ncbi:hypothetical protein CPB83DRAFT_858763 [Crepidotus variabilis]|uniref:F-box domain-containing protein n=1 Tax=Crepidotus variabilis TaxID=179855 RepID=A0A9P6EBH0_9AGAR|nr:hypothetical protein CPB83DRAFT_858763 [Crepidotus variabilis]
MTRQLLLDLPKELLERILEILHDEGNLLSLGACSLTCHNLSVWSQRLLFRRIKLKAHFQRNVIPLHYFLPIPEGFIFLLRESPHLSEYIKNFELELKMTPTQPTPTIIVNQSSKTRNKGRRAGSSDTTSQNTPAAAVPEPRSPSEEDSPLVQNLFIGLNEFRLTAINDRYYACPWYLSNSGLVKTLGQALAITSSLKVLDVTGVPDFPLSILKGCAIPSLWVSRLVEDEEYTAEEVAESRNTALKSKTACISQRETLGCAPSFLHLGGTSSIYTIELLTNTHGAVNLDNLVTLSIEFSNSFQNTRGIKGSDWPQVANLHLRAPDSSAHRTDSIACELQGPTIHYFALSGSTRYLSRTNLETDCWPLPWFNGLRIVLHH